MPRLRLGVLMLTGIAACGGGRDGAAPPAPAGGGSAATAASAIPALTFNPKNIRESSDLYQVFMTQQGRQIRIGEQAVTVRRDGGNYRIISQVAALAVGLEGTSAYVLSANNLTGVSLIEDMTWQGQPFASDVTAFGGRITGTMSMPDGQSGKIKKVDVEAPAFVILDSEVLVALLPSAELAAGMVGEFPAIDRETGTLRPLKITIGKAESVSVPAGRFDAYRVRAQARETTFCYVTVATPHRVVKCVFGDAIELRLAP